MATIVRHPDPPTPLHTYDVFADDGAMLGYVRRHKSRFVGWQVYRRLADGRFRYVGGAETRREAIVWLQMRRPGDI